MDATSQLPQSRAEMSATANSTTQVAWFYGGRSTEEKQQAGEQLYASNTLMTKGIDMLLMQSSIILV